MTTKNFTLIKMKDTGAILLVRLLKNNGDFGSISYDQEYEAYDYNKLIELSSKGEITFDELQSAKLNNLVVKGVTLPFEYGQDAAINLPPIRIIEHTTYTIDIAKPKQPINPEWTFD